ncbi:hypothetical protein Zmor_025603 [Zophobas morio]|uniref:Uncharacterized protein n=1 Tax=Zophobas morio TaxID=2755281 RepID=A0AA38HX48_9CUCU|nr:hypothetical protein Zmor_025603 [Zophobas morio]
MRPLAWKESVTESWTRWIQTEVKKLRSSAGTRRIRGGNPVLGVCLMQMGSVRRVCGMGNERIFFLSREQSSIHLPFSLNAIISSSPVKRLKRNKPLKSATLKYKVC